MKEKDFSEFENKIGIKFNDQSILKQAFTHRSFLNENKNLKGGHNERLEFLGDAVLELATTDFLYNKYPEKNEGDLTSIRSALVNAQTCAEVAREIKANDFLLLSRGEAKDEGRARQYILANALEAIIGAIYIDSGYNNARDFILKYITPKTEQIVEEELWIDAKSKFQEKAQDIVSITPSYKTMKEIGPDHDKKFTVGVFLDGELVSEGNGESKQDAEQSAARKALKNKNWN
ncbi:MAG: Ribonuclease 3 [Parcubacteria group bacterium GW2011_GWC1_34_10]|uniref:Ribonuclease 3 n=1 Tax=Candidatus Zambryskibacteria bacterium RIFCSPLOWO2_01_FULL_35_19 TaxID=1802757 RepID=A0A1G2TV11_9BACT|nr:MAG: Ribonuclease 3 [Parcubacteria group bacterium GW2011_GWC1_34_10]OHA85984.1 MAG: ribonuclease III [Candidatus Zambryskibacteria bacterium RIFCSPHIGHO2_01_FULL_35_32]OHB01148.1 MAG: ribonuclease III [Candidatus Zambryskibacteria bacterium RIFCSPLOWO2_01_FULL_35_19]